MFELILNKPWDVGYTNGLGLLNAKSEVDLSQKNTETVSIETAFQHRQRKQEKY